MTFTQDDFLGGRLKVRQPVTGYRAGADPVFLAAAVPAVAGERVLELGCGSGVALLCLMSRVPGLTAVGVERNKPAAQLARENIAANGVKAQIVTADVAGLPGEVTATGFHHVMTNPPFFDRGKGSQAADAGREEGRGQDTPLSTWIDVALRRLLPGGTLTLIQRAERLPDCLAALDERVGSTAVMPLVPRAGRSAKLVVLQAKKGARGTFRIKSPFVLHEGDRHTADGNSYTAAARGILRDGRPLSLAD